MNNVSSKASFFSSPEALTEIIEKIFTISDTPYLEIKISGITFCIICQYFVESYSANDDRSLRCHIKSVIERVARYYMPHVAAHRTAGISLFFCASICAGPSPTCRSQIAKVRLYPVTVNDELFCLRL